MNLKQLLDTFPAWSEQYGLGGQINEDGSLFMAAVDRGGDEPSVGTAVLEKTQSAERKHHMESEMKTSELTGVALDWAVAKCEDYVAEISRGGWVVFDTHQDCPPPINDYNDSRWQMYSPSTDWTQGGPIIERERIRLDPRGVWVAGHDSSNDEYLGTTPLIAAMRCYVASKLGDEIELPEELK
jgi:hypothetical protein